jgi:uncharacterized protein (TIGR03089 family)
VTASPPPRPPASTPADLLDGALRADPARALLTYYDDATGERTELSVATFANWVAKTANLCRDGLGLDVGATVAIDLPLHWQAAVWWQACWTSGFVATPAPVAWREEERQVGGQAYDVAVVAVDGVPAGRQPPATRTAGEVVGLGLGPMGLPVHGRATPPEVTLDYDREVHGHADRFERSRIEGSTPALALGAVTMTAEQLADATDVAVRRWGLTSADRVLTTATLADLPGLLGGLLGPLASGAGSLLCRNLDRVGAETLARRLGQEGVTRAAATSRFEAAGVRRLD